MKTRELPNPRLRLRNSRHISVLKTICVHDFTPKKNKKGTFLPLENKKIGFLVVLIISMFGRSLNIRVYGNF